MWEIILHYWKTSVDTSYYFLLNRPQNKSDFTDYIFHSSHFIPHRQNLELLGSSCVIKAFLYRGLKHIKNTKLELNVQEKYYILIKCTSSES